MLTIGAIPNPETPLRYAPKVPIFQAFAQVAAQTPKAPALVYKGGLYSFQELDQVSTRLSNHLFERNVRRGKSVLILTDRNPAFVCAILGVLKAGALFCIADSTYPRERILDYARRLKPMCLLVCGEIALPEDLGRALAAIGVEQILRVPSSKDEAFALLAQASESPPAVTITAQDPAYAGFTSGSTGEPKGIVTSHPPLSHFVEWHVRRHGFTSQDHFSLLSGLSHDPVLRDIFTPLSIGASLHIPEQSQILDPVGLVDWLAEQEITVSHLTPAIGDIIIEGSQDRRPLEKLRFLFWGGDVLNSRTCRRMLIIAPQAKQVNFYGTTETPQAMAYFDVDPDSSQDGFPIGKGIDDTHLLVMTNSRKLAAMGELGEIWVRTPYLSQGYLNDPGLTAEKFVSNPYSNEPGDTCYRTGDLGRTLEDGNVAFAGRSDHQVKIRGFRVELGEVTRRTEEYPGVSRAVVLAQPNESGTKVLVAYLTKESGRTVKATEVRGALARSLPSYMVPSFVVPLERFPLLPNGKIDVQALPSPKFSESSRTAEYVPPTTDLEKKLVEVWQKILGVEKVGINDSFLDLGGDSLTALRALIRVRKLGVPAKFSRGILQGKTIAEIVRESEEPTAGATRDTTTLSPEAKTNLLVSVLRGILVMILVTDHWFGGLLNRLPAGMAFVEKTLAPLFGIATPGFAFMFGITLGYVYYARYLQNPPQVRKTLRYGLWMLTAAVIVRSASILARLRIEGAALDSTIFFNTFFSALLYYALALLSASLWFRVIARSRREYLACALLLVASFLLHQVSLWLLLYREQTGFLQLCRLMLVAKFAYFNMSLGAFGGLAVGIYLRRRGSQELPTALLFASGIVGIVAGTALLRVGSGSLGGFYNSSDMHLWRWIVYSGAVLVLGGCISRLLVSYSSLPTAARQALHLTGVLGQCSLLVFVLHLFVLDAKFFLVSLGIPGVPALLVPMVAFFLFIGWSMKGIYRLHYGSIRD